MDKSHVTLERRVCNVCAKEYDTGALLLDKRLRPVFDHYTVTGFGLCETCEKLHKDGFIALVECDETKSNIQHDKILKQKDAYRTGRIAHLRRSVFSQVFNTPLDDKLPMVFVDSGVIDKLESMKEPTA